MKLSDIDSTRRIDFIIEQCLRHGVIVEHRGEVWDVWYASERKPFRFYSKEEVARFLLRDNPGYFEE